MNRVLMWGACATLVLTGCATSPPPSDRGKGGALTPKEVHGFYQKARDARHFWLHVANTDHGPRFDGAHQAKQDRHTELDFIGPGDTFLPLIHIEDNLPNRYNALIDTSSAENWVGLTESRSMWLVPIKEPAYRTQPTHLADPVNGFLCLGEKIRVGSIVVNNALFFTRGWHDSLRGPLLRGIQKPVPQCVLGMRFLRGFDTVQIHFPHRKISFATNEFYKPTISRLAAALPMIDDHGPLAVDGEMNGRDIVLILDSAARFAISDALYPLTQITSLRIGDLHLTDLTNNRAMAKTLGGESFPRLGLHVLSRFILTLDNRAGKIFLELPEEGA